MKTNQGFARNKYDSFMFLKIEQLRNAIMRKKYIYILIANLQENNKITPYFGKR